MRVADFALLTCLWLGCSGPEPVVHETVDAARIPEDGIVFDGCGWVGQHGCQLGEICVAAVSEENERLDNVCVEGGVDRLLEPGEPCERFDGPEHGSTYSTCHAGLCIDERCVQFCVPGQLKCNGECMVGPYPWVGEALCFLTP